MPFKGVPPPRALQFEKGFVGRGRKTKPPAAGLSMGAIFINDNGEDCAGALAYGSLWTKVGREEGTALPVWLKKG